MTLRRAACLALLVSLLLAACTGEPGQPDQTGPAGASAEPTSAEGADVRLDCEREGYPCSRDDVDPAVIERESQYVAQLRPLLTADTFTDALDWIRRQDGVAMAEANDTTLLFRLDGGRPFFVIRPERDRDAAAAVAPSVPEITLAGVVGQGTARDNPQNRKKALFLEPWQSHGLRFADGIDLVRGIGQYGRDGVDVLPDGEATVDDFTFDMWNGYDAVFLKSHGGSLGGQTWISSGVRAELGNRDFATLCDALYSPRPVGVDCSLVLESELDAQGNYVQEPDGSWKLIDWIAVGMQVDYFIREFGTRGGLEKTFVYFGACDSFSPAVRGPELAAAIAGNSSVFLGWRGQPIDITEGRTARALMQRLVTNLQPTAPAHTSACANGGCRDPVSGATLEIHGSADARQLRLYDVPTELRHPSRGATPINVGPPLEDGARVPIIGTPGDGRNDEVELMIDFIGIIDPEDTGSDLVGQTGVRLASAQLGDGLLAQTSEAARLYHFTVEANGTVVVRDNLGDPQHPGASATPLDATTSRYSFTAELPFDVAPAGTPATIKVTVDPLPEGGISDYELDVILDGSRPVCDVIEPAIDRIVSAFGTGLPLDEWGAPGGSRSECVIKLEGRNPSGALYAPDLTARISIARQPALVRSVADAVLGYEGAVSPAPSLGEDAVVVEVPHGLFPDAPPIPHLLFFHGDRVYLVTGEYPDTFEIWANNPDEGGMDLDLAETPIEAVVAVAEIVLDLLGGQPIPSPPESAVSS